MGVLRPLPVGAVLSLPAHDLPWRMTTAINDSIAMRMLSRTGRCYGACVGPRDSSDIPASIARHRGERSGRRWTPRGRRIGRWIAAAVGIGDRRRSDGSCFDRSRRPFSKATRPCAIASNRLRCAAARRCVDLAFGVELLTVRTGEAAYKQLQIPDSSAAFRGQPQVGRLCVHALIDDAWPRLLP